MYINFVCITLFKKIINKVCLVFKWVLDNVSMEKCFKFSYFIGWISADKINPDTA